MLGRFDPAKVLRIEYSQIREIQRSPIKFFSGCTENFSSHFPKDFYAPISRLVVVPKQIPVGFTSASKVIHAL